MISVRSRNCLLAVWVGSWEDDPNTRPKGFNASPESRAVVLDKRRRNYLLPTGRLSSEATQPAGAT